MSHHKKFFFINAFTFIFIHLLFLFHMWIDFFLLGIIVKLQNDLQGKDF